jgi:hypothetical protein
MWIVVCHIFKVSEVERMSNYSFPKYSATWEGVATFMWRV